ncbi:DoxX family protein [Flavobacterium ardleyense]|uniref:DoxX family protein n=1 Tax=Flavobacterium ardleyense TaxID=2038737 RepID=UPI00298D401A|nr:DoxX family protein [Flavobacterium ardleyense]
MIKSFFNPGTYSQNINLTLLLLRIVAGIFMLTHGIGKFEQLMGESPIQFPDPLGVGASASLFLAVFAEVFCSLLLIFGLATRFSAAVLLITMLVAAFVFHINDEFARQELPLLYATMYAMLLLLGAGKFSVDQLIYTNLTRNSRIS